MSESLSPDLPVAGEETGGGLMAAVDLGSNSFQLLVGDFHHGQLRIVDRLREMVRIAAGLDEHHELDADSQQRALDCLARFGERLRDIPAGRVRAVGTNTLRMAKDPAAFLDRATELLGHEIEIISGIEEARLIFIGVSHSLAAVRGRQLVVDIGGGSTELAAGKGYEPQQLESLYMGCVGMSERFFGDGRLTRANFTAARTAARLELRPVVQSFRAKGWKRAAGASGTIRAAGAVLQELGLATPHINVAGLEQLIDIIIERGRVERLNLPGLNDDRAPVFAGGVAILVEVLAELGIVQLVAAQGALREGILYDLEGRLTHEDSRLRTVRAMESRYSVDAEQAARVELTAVSLLDQVATEWKLDQPNVRNLLGWAARLHEIGLDIAHSHYHRHGAYLLEHADMPGFNRREQSLLAAVVGAHRRKLVPASIAAIAPQDWEKRAVRLAILLRLAVLFNRSRTYEFPEMMRIKVQGKKIELCLSRDWLQSNPLSLADLECEQDFLRAAGYRMKIVAVDETVLPAG